ncbi:MAG: protein-disulfide reductase DsbD family protein [Bdellovibrionales bacterium]
MKYIILPLFFFISAPGFAQDLFEPAKKSINKSPLTVEQVLTSFAKNSNKKSYITVHLKLAKKHNAYDSVFKVKSKDENLKVSTPEVSPLFPYVDKFSNGKERMVMKDSATMRFFFSSSKALSGVYKLSLTYQACTTEYCLLPQDLSFDLKFPIVENLEENSTESFSFKNLFANIDTMPVWLILLATYFFGLLTAFTPCVLPMIPITMGILGFSETSNRAKGFVIGLAYALGLSVTYALVGVAAAMTGGFIGQALTNPYIVWGVFIFYVFTAAAMAGFFTIKAPSSVEKHFTKIQNKGLIGAFLAGAVAGIIASPCVGPAVAAVLAYVAQTGEPSFGFITLFTFGMGLGTLFILIGTFYGEINSRLQPGKWLNYIKYILAFLILLGALLFIKPHLTFLNDSHSHSEQVESSLWTPFTNSLYTEAIKENKAIIIDFRADWCAACHELDQHTFSTEGFKEETKDIVLLKFDATKPTVKEQKELQFFDVFGLPTVLFIGSNGKVREDLTLTGFEEWPEFQKRIQALRK